MVREGIRLKKGVFRDMLFLETPEPVARYHWAGETAVTALVEANQLVWEELGTAMAFCGHHGISGKRFGT